MLVVLTLRPMRGRTLKETAVDGNRLLAMLPRQWDKEFMQTAGFIAIRISTEEEIRTAHVHAQVVSVLANPELGPWRLVSYETLLRDPNPPRALVPVATARQVDQHAAWN
ncbi:hypothetical protein Sme01_58420 [Sphaerisporangium melleum]|uniref:Uncharacterized protein n=1 Tax=Sphaerisporangium melleum TaxID=321316 RepID=A0A917R7G6_9ACTN|nr:hypothetical protein [Sphaerisporangium melleum]GGK93892.1 hypothetical protein GCM10007964_40350 [Sphaerisporangium melleum]GII73366.1 hypothetical protein Sme01_58420 [Sphaerisporangium melleum]